MGRRSAGWVDYKPPLHAGRQATGIGGGCGGCGGCVGGEKSASTATGEIGEIISDHPFGLLGSTMRSAADELASHLTRANKNGSFPTDQ